MLWSIRCCRDCPPEKRYPACWGSCKTYIDERKKLEAAKAKKCKEEKIFGKYSSGLYSRKNNR